MKKKRSALSRTDANLLKGTHKLKRTTISEVVEAKKIGVYVVGYVEDENFYVRYVGRSDEHDLDGRIRARVGKHRDETHFKFRYCNKAPTAFHLECGLYHKHKGFIRNKIHPDRPKSMKYPCPVPGCDELETS